jgi:hypothetical protein
MLCPRLSDSWHRHVFELGQFYPNTITVAQEATIVSPPIGVAPGQIGQKCGWFGCRIRWVLRSEQVGMTASMESQVLSVIRNTRQRWFAVAVVLLMCFFIGDGVVENSNGGELADQLGFYFVMAIPTWLVWRAVVCSRIVVTTWGLIIVNWFRIYSVPWSSVRSIEAGEELTVVLADGREVRPAVGGGSLAGSLHGSPEQRALRDRIDSARASAQQSGDTAATSRIDLYAKQAVPVILVGAVLVVAPRRLGAGRAVRLARLPPPRHPAMASPNSPSWAPASTTPPPAASSPPTPNPAAPRTTTAPPTPSTAPTPTASGLISITGRLPSALASPSLAPQRCSDASCATSP